MAPKKKQEEKPPPPPEELLPNGYSIDCQVFWRGHPAMLGEDATFIVRPGFKGRLVAVPDMVEFEKDDGEKGYSLETVLVVFGDQTEPHKVPLKSLLLKPPARDTVWNVKPFLLRKYVKLVPPATSSQSPGRRPPSRSRDEERDRLFSRSGRSSPTQDAEKVGSPFVNALMMLDVYPHRTDKVEHILKPSLVEFLNNTDFQYSSNSLGNHRDVCIDWRAIYPWLVGVLKEANIQGDLSPQLIINADVYESLVRKFDKRAGQFINHCPFSEDILPFGKFVVTRLYLELQQEIEKRLEMEVQMKDLVEREGEQDGCLRFAASWDTDDDVCLRVGLPEDFGDINFGQQIGADSLGIQLCNDMEKGQASLTVPMLTISWAVFDSRAIGKDAPLCPPVGQYSVWLHMAVRRSTSPCHWACQAVVGGASQVFGGTWHDGDDEFIQVASVVFSEPSSN